MDSLNSNPNFIVPLTETEDALQKALDKLHAEASANRNAFNIGKASGLGALTLGAIGCIALPVLGIPAAAIGSIIYVGSLLSESTTTGDITPIPFSAVRLTTMFAGLLQESTGVTDEDLEFAEYLPKRDRILYLLILTQGKRMAVMLSQIPKNQWQPSLEAIITKTDKIIRAHGGKFDYATAFSDGAGIVTVAEETLGLPSSKPVPDSWAAMPQAPDEPVRITTQLGEPSAIDVPAASKTAAAQLSKQQVIDLPMLDRARYLMQLLADSGCDLRKLVGRSTLAAGGLQRSGKTTLIILLAIFEKAMGQRLFYVSRDNDLYPVAFDGYANGSTANAVQALTILSDRINGGSMGSLTGETWILDEFSSTAKELDDKTRDAFWSMALTGFAKQGGRVRFLVHHKTASANGIPKGESETFKAEVKMFWTERLETESGYQPSGQYELLQEVEGHYKESGEKFIIPDWLLTDTNPNWHNAPCPVRSLLTFFPELDTRKGAKAEPLIKPKANPFGEPPKVETRVAQDLERMFNLPAVVPESLVEDSGEESSSTQDRLREVFPAWRQPSIEVATKVIEYLETRRSETFKAHRIKSGLKHISLVSAATPERFKDLLVKLSEAQLIQATDKEEFTAIDQPQQTTSDNFDW